MRLFCEKKASSWREYIITLEFDPEYMREEQGEWTLLMKRDQH